MGLVILCGYRTEASSIFSWQFLDDAQETPKGERVDKKAPEDSNVPVDSFCT
jgi:hypothetical protein